MVGWRRTGRLVEGGEHADLAVGVAEQALAGAE